MTTDVIGTVLMLFNRYGEERYGEDTTQLSHALQCAALARAHGRSDTLIVAALLHDVGQFVADAGLMAERAEVDARHEELGYRLLSAAFPAAVTDPIRLHVAAKRYLCTIDPAYAAQLSAASQLSLRLQGGAMSDAERLAFEREPFFADAVTLRRFDDAGKAPDLDVTGLASYLALLEAQVIRPV